MFPRLMEFYILRWRFDTELKIINSSIWIRLLRNILIFFFSQSSLITISYSKI